MLPLDSLYASKRIPDGYLAIALSQDQLRATLRLCILVKQEEEPVGGHLVVLREHLDGRVYLGGVLDAGDHVLNWVELWVQRIEGVQRVPHDHRKSLTNQIVDDRWRRFADALEGLYDGDLIKTGWETNHALPCFIHLSEASPVHPVHEGTQTPWRLCVDDALLQRHGLPPYSTTLDRYWYAPENGEDNASFVPVTSQAPINERTISLDQVVPPGNGLIPLNPEGGLLLVRPAYPLGYDEYVGVLGGAAWEGRSHGRSMLDQQDAGSRLGTVDDPNRCFLGLHGTAGHLIEVLHLKLCALADVFELVRKVVRHQQRPLLNLSGESLRIRLASSGAGLPTLWTAKVSLTDPGEVTAVPLENSAAPYFLAPRAQELSIYRPAPSSSDVRGRCHVRVRKLLNTSREETIVEGTLQTENRLDVGPHDLVWIRLSLGETPCDLYVKLEASDALAQGEWRFRSFGRQFEDPIKDRLKAAEGVPLSETPFELLPLVSTPYDLYALAVLSVKTLLTDKTMKLPIAVDEMISLTREVSMQSEPEEDLPQCIANVFSRDIRWAESLGPHRVIQEEVGHEEGFSSVPASIWWNVLAMVVRMWPGTSVHSTCRHYGDAARGAQDKVFDRAVEDARDLVARTRALVVTDWPYNQEVHRVIDAVLEQVENV